MMVWISLIVSLSVTAQARVVDGVDLVEAMMVGTYQLKLMEVQHRNSEFGSPRVPDFLMALYGQSESSTFIESPYPKVVEWVFLHRVDRETLQKWWTKGFEAHCKTSCESTRTQLKVFNDLMMDVRDKYRLRLKFTKDSIEVMISGAGIKPKPSVVFSESLRSALLEALLAPKKLER